MNLPPPANASPAPRERAGLWEIAAVFLKLGTIAFGGPAAHIALMEAEFVSRRGWLSRQEFLDRLGAANLIPGPNSTEMAIFIGQSRAGWPGLIVAGTCFIIPASIIVAAIAAAYVRYGVLPQVSGVLYGVKAVVIAIIAHAFWKLAQSAVKSRYLALIGVVSAALAFLAVNNLLILAIAALMAALPKLRRKHQMTIPILFTPALVPIAGLSAPAGFSLLRLFLVFLKTGAVLFGSGYVLLAFLRADFVVRLHWLTEKQLLDAVAVGQVTPGPVFTTATFSGYLLAGVPGAALATIAIFLPGFLLVAASGPLISKMRRSPLTGAAFDGVVVASLALMGVVAWQLGKSALVDWTTLVMALASLLLLLTSRVNAMWLILGAGMVGLLRSFQ
ncbi:MAG TPA: chromate efflux transporter [Terriglobales bacterium]|nr:chromate efflux transporter [Terriglobales bacterium]